MMIRETWLEMQDNWPKALVLKNKNDFFFN